MNAPLFDPWQWIRDNADDPAQCPPTLATLATLAGPGDWPSLPAEWRAGLASLRDAARPLHISAAAWERLVSNTLGIADDWAAPAAALGWTALNLFGVNPGPGGRLDRDGLAAGLEGRRVVAVTTDAATLQTPSGGLLRHYRRDKPGTVPVWVLINGRYR